MIYAIDFDGTLCDDDFPKIGYEKKHMVQYVKDGQARGDRFILWTCRSGPLLRAAVDWCQARGLTFAAVNENLPEHIAEYGGDTRKVFADRYIDDKNLHFSPNFI